MGSRAPASTTRGDAGIVSRDGYEGCPWLWLPRSSSLVGWGRGTPPSLTLVVLVALIYALYVLPSRLRQYVVPVTVLGLAIAYPIFYRGELALSGSVPDLHEPSQRWTRW